MGKFKPNRNTSADFLHNSNKSNVERESIKILSGYKSKLKPISHFDNSPRNELPHIESTNYTSFTLSQNKKVGSA